MNEEQIKSIFHELADLVFAYDLITESEISDSTPFQPVYRQFNLRFRSLLDNAVKAGGLD